MRLQPGGKTAERRIARGGDKVDLSKLELSSVPDSLAGLTHLTDLDLTGNKLTALPDWLGTFSSLTRLKLSLNTLWRLPDWIGDLTRLTDLRLLGCELESLPDAVGNLVNLVKLDLQINNLVALPGSLTRLTRLESIDLFRNSLTELPESFGELGALKSLNLRHNRLSALPKSLGDLSALRSLSLGENPWIDPSPQVVASGTKAVLDYLRATRHFPAGQWTAKLSIVGEGGSGKTSLAKALAGLPHNPGELTTHGMRVTDLPMPHPERPGTAMSLSVWDFGGQDIYHTTHQFFLTDQSVCLLVWNARTGTQAGRLRYWLDTVTARAPAAPILLVATHTASHPADVDLSGLLADFPRIAGLFPVDCGDGRGMSALAAALAEQAARLPMMGAAWPAAWNSAAGALRGPQQPECTGVARMRETMAAAGVTEREEQHALAAALHERGQILYFPEDQRLADTVVLAPQWLSTQISRILDQPAIAAHGGLLTTADINLAWDHLEHTQREYLLEVMQRFDLAYRIREDGDGDGALAVVVNLLPQTSPAFRDDWDELYRDPGHRQIRLRYELPVLPPGIPGWLLARAHRFATPLRWRNGALLRHPDGLHIGLVQTDPDRHTIDLAVRGPLPAAFFAVLDDGLNLTLDRYPGLAISRQVPCCGHGGAPCPKLFNYTKLVGRLTRGHRDAYCDEAEESVDIAEMLLGISPTVRDLTGADLNRLLDTMAAQNRQTQQTVLKVQTLIQRTQDAHCPSVFTLTPDGRRRPGKVGFTLRLYCEEPGLWHPLPGTAGCYEVVDLADWLRKAAPYLQRTLNLLKAATPYIGPILGVAAHELNAQLQHDVDLARQLLDRNPGHLAALDEPFATLGTETRQRPASQADTDADFRVLRAMLEALDPQRSWGGLSHVLTPEGLSLYVCSEHLDAYSKPAGQA
jgi:internalin A